MVVFLKFSVKMLSDNRWLSLVSFGEIKKILEKHP
jgi:hypothetical protein